MRRLARWMFNAAWGFSLLMVVMLAVLWIRSNTKSTNFDIFFLPGGRTVRSDKGYLTLSLPPNCWEVVGDDPVAAKIIEKLANDDVILLSADMPEGKYRQGSAAWELFEEMKGFDSRQRFLPVERLLLIALNDKNKFMAAQMLLSLAWGTTEGGDFHGPDQFAFPSIAGSPLSAQPSDFMSWRPVRYFWHRNLDLEIITTWYGTLLGIALLLPMFRASRPRQGTRSVWRWTFNFLTFLSLMLAVPGVVGWWDSTRSPREMVTFFKTNRNLKFYVQALTHSTDGKLTLSIDRREIFIEHADWVLVRAIVPPSQSTSLRFPSFHFGFSRINGLGNDNRVRVTLAAPYWAIVAGSLALPAFWIARARKTIGPDFCATCGYDLRATRDRCPECGTAGMSVEPTGASPATRD